MFRTREEALDYTVRPAGGALDVLVEEANGRIQLGDAYDYLDGFKLPPDNDEMFGGPNPYTLHIDKWDVMLNDRGAKEIIVTHESHNVDATFTNSEVRKANVRAIVSCGLPLFVLWQDVMPPDAERKQPLYRRFRRMARDILQKIAA
jgi:hypothetical protein